MVREAGYDDIDTLVELAIKFHSMSPFAAYRFSPNGTRSYLKWIIRNPNSVILTNGFGAIGGIVDDYPFCEVRVAKELFWYAEKGGIELLRAFNEWVDQMGADVELISSIETSGHGQETFQRLLRKFGYGRVETLYQRSVD